MLTDYQLVMNKGVSSFISKLNKLAAEDKEFDVQHLLNLVTLDVISGKENKM